MQDVPIGALVAMLVALLLVSACFSGSETGMMALNRYRLRHLARARHRGALRAAALLERPDRLIGLILLGNNFVNIVASMLTLVIAQRLFGVAGLAAAPFVLTAIILIFAEVAPKTFAAMYPERVAFPAAFVLRPLMTVSYPMVVALNWLANGVLRLLRVRVGDFDAETLSSEELRTVVNEAGAMISSRHQRMLVSILDLEKVVVDDIMVPRNEINGLDLDDEIEAIVEQLSHSLHTRLPVFRGDVDNVVGILHLRKIAWLWEHNDLTRELILEHADEPYFVPAGTPLNTQLRNFQQRQERIGLVVDEYGDIDGLLTLDDLLEEIVGEFTTDPSEHSADVHPQSDGTFLVDGSTSVRDLNRAMSWDLPTDGPRTVNGLVLEAMETIPEPGTSLLIAGYPVEIMQAGANAVKTVRVSPAMRQGAPREPEHDT